MGENVVNIYIYETRTRCYEKVPIRDFRNDKIRLLERKSESMSAEHTGHS